jgi:alkaline phosphatase D
MLTRRDFGSLLLGTAAVPFVPRNSEGTRAFLVRDEARPAIPYGVASGEVAGGSAVVWSRTDRPARMIVEYATTEAFRDSRRVLGPAAFPEDDYTAKVVLTDLPAGQQIFYRVTFQDLGSPKVSSHPAAGRFRTPSDVPSDIRFAFGGDTAGQGFGIDVVRGGMQSFETMRRVQPDFFLNSGDLIYADNPINAEVRLDDGTIWKNLVTEETSKVAETLAEFRGRYKYNLMDENVRRFNAEVPQFVQWDDHETRNNWYPGQRLDDDSRFAVKSVDLLAARAKRAFFEFTPTRLNPVESERVYRSIRYGPLLEIFLLDQRSYRGPNSTNRQAELGEATAFLGAEQARWLARVLRESKATWKVVASDMPIGLVVKDGPSAFEALANGDNGLPLGRELELAWILKSLKAGGVRNVVWLTADVHYAAAHHYDPARATFHDFDPFWEFVAGPLHAGTFGPSTLDGTFGPEVKFQSVPNGMKPNRPPSAGLQFFGNARIDGKSRVLTVGLHDREGKVLYAVDLAPEI